MVIVQSAPLQLRALIDFFNTESCWYTVVRVEYAGDTMEPRQPDKHHPSDRRLRPRAQLCARCRRPLGAHTVCPCKAQDATAKKALAKVFKTEDNSVSQAAQFQESPRLLSSNHTATSSSDTPAVDYGYEMTRVERGFRSSDLGSETSGHPYSDSDSQPSTSRLTGDDPALVDTPRRTVSPVPRRLFHGRPQLAGFTLVTKEANVAAAVSKPPAKGKAKAGAKAKAAGKSASETSRGFKDVGQLPSILPFKGPVMFSLGPVKVSVAPAKGSSSLKGTLKGAGQGSDLPRGPKVKPGASKDFRFVPETQQQSQYSGEFSGVTERVLSAEGSGIVEGESSGSSTAATPESSQRGAPPRYVCEDCGKVFVSPGKLNQHRFSHTGERPFQCGECSKAFSSKFKLVRHNLIHSSERRFVCATCQRPFHRRDHLTNHAKIHSAVKLKFVCDRAGCHKEYGSANSARKHSVAHAAQDGNLVCVLCGRRFATTPEVLHHLKVHAGARAVKTPADRKFRCEHCDRKFYTRKDVRRHLVVHTGLRDFVCQICPQKFGRKDHLVRHVKKSHQGGRSKGKKRIQRRVAQREANVETVVVTPSTDEPEFKEEPEYPSYPSTSSEAKVEELPPYDIAGQLLKQQVEMIPLYPPPPYPKHDDLQFYSIDPELQKLFNSETDNGSYLMHLMDSVDLTSNNHNSSILRRVLSDECLSNDPLEITASDILLATNLSQSSLSSTSSGLMSSPNGSTTSALAPPLELCEAMPLAGGEDGAGLEAFDNEHHFAPLPRFNQAFPQPPQ